MRAQPDQERDEKFGQVLLPRAHWSNAEDGIVGNCGGVNEEDVVVL